MRRLIAFLYRCFYNLVSKRQPPPLRAVSAQAALWLFALLASFSCCSLLSKALAARSLLPIPDFVFAGFCGLSGWLSVRYFTRHAPRYDASYQGDTGRVRVGYALLGVLFFVLLGLLCTHP
jgi:hypothetical protein